MTVALAGAALTACGGAGEGTAADDAPSATGTSAAASRPVHDPPAKFATRGFQMPDEADPESVEPLPVTLYGSTAYVGAFDHVQAVDTTSGHVTATIEPTGKALAESETGTSTEDSVGAPALVSIGGTPALVTPFPVEQAGTGTQADHRALEVVVSDPATAKPRWRVTLRLPKWADETAAKLTASAVGADGNVGIVSVYDDVLGAVTYGVDLTTHQQVWAQNGFTATGVAEGTAIGWHPENSDKYPVGHDAATGKRRWQGDYLGGQTVSAAGPHFVLLAGGRWGSDKQRVQLLDPATGKVKQSLPAELDQGTCVYDEKSALVCYRTDSDADEAVAVGLDATTGKLLWQLPDKQADRIAPQITTAWHGRVYGQTAKAPVALDARTGKDLPTSPGIAPVLVNGSAGLAPDKVDGWKNKLFVYPTTG